MMAPTAKVITSPTRPPPGLMLWSEIASDFNTADARVVASPRSEVRNSIFS